MMVLMATKKSKIVRITFCDLCVRSTTVVQHNQYVKMYTPIEGNEYYSFAPYKVRARSTQCYAVYKHLLPRGKCEYVVIRHSEKDYLSTCDDDDYVIEIMSRHAGVASAKERMKELIKIAKKRQPQPKKFGERCHTMIGKSKKIPVTVGSLIVRSGQSRIAYRVISEVYHENEGGFALKIQKALCLDVKVSSKIPKSMIINEYDNEFYVPIDIVTLGTVYARLGEFLKEEVKRMSGELT
jgi:hypothetical protein